MIPRDTEIEHVSITFYKWQFAATLAWWILVKVTMNKFLDEVTYGSVATTPSWMSRELLHQLQSPKNRARIFRLSLLSLAVGGWGIPVASVDPRSLLLRLVVACCVSIYHLVESSVTHRHGEYPLLYNVWAMCLPMEYARAVSWGIAVHFVLSTGIAKLIVGGRQWASPMTMKYYLEVYRAARMKISQPFISSLNLWVCQRGWATTLISVVALLLECLLVPFTLFLQPQHRCWGSLGMMGMHLGIFFIMSKKVGLVFATTFPTYIIGFGCSAEMGTSPWWVATVVALGPTAISLYVLKGGMLCENWPLSPVSLFMWSGDQALQLGETLMMGETRVVLGTIDKTSTNIVGLPVIHHGAVTPTVTKSYEKSSDEAVHDCVLRVIGFTILQGALAATAPQPGKPWDVVQFVRALQLFLESEQRLFETRSGKQLVKAFYVRIGSKGCVSKVLSEG